jgi:hypothetical protein
MGLILAAATYGFAAANDVPDGVAGEGSGAISGYTVSNVKYTLDSSDPTLFAMVQFDLDGSASDVYAGIGAGGSIDWVPCTTGAVYDFDCDLTGISNTVSAADALHVSSVQ